MRFEVFAVFAGRTLSGAATLRSFLRTVLWVLRHCAHTKANPCRANLVEHAYEWESSTSACLGRIE